MWRRRISDISEDIHEQLTDQIRTSRFTLYVDEETDVIKDAHLITCVPYALEME